MKDKNERKQKKKTNIIYQEAFFSLIKGFYGLIYVLKSRNSNHNTLESLFTSFVLFDARSPS